MGRISCRTGVMSSSSWSSRRVSHWTGIALVLVLGLGTKGPKRFAVASFAEDPPVTTVVGGGLHHDPAMACAGCAAVAHTLRRLLERPSGDERLPVFVTEFGEETGSDVAVRYRQSTEFKEAALARTCAPASLNLFAKTKTWLGDTTWRPDDLPWNVESKKRGADEDLRRICERATLKHKKLLLRAAAAGDPSAACRALGCGALPGLGNAFAETSAKMLRNPTVCLKLAPVFLVALFLPATLRAAAHPPKPPSDATAQLAAVRAARVNARAGSETKGKDWGRPRKRQGGKTHHR